MAHDVMIGPFSYDREGGNFGVIKGYFPVGSGGDF
jgi:hypothetical protein